jgi:hypothetical protein
MIRPLRATHRIVFFMLAIVLPLVFASGILSRHHVHSASTIQGSSALVSTSVVSEKSAVVSGSKLTVRILRDSSSAEVRQLQLVSGSSLTAPDLLVYWCEKASQGSLPDGAQLLGPFRASSYYRLPPGAEDKGSIILYSLAHGQILALIPLENQP